MNGFVCGTVKKLETAATVKTASGAGQSQSLWKCYLPHPYVACWQGDEREIDFDVLSMI